MSVPHNSSRNIDLVWDYIAAWKIICAPKVLNNCAKRSIKLATDFNEVFIKDGHQCSLLCQVNEDHLEILPTSAAKDQLLITQ